MDPTKHEIPKRLLWCTSDSQFWLSVLPGSGGTASDPELQAIKGIWNWSPTASDSEIQEIGATRCQLGLPLTPAILQPRLSGVPATGRGYDAGCQGYLNRLVGQGWSGRLVWSGLVDWRWSGLSLTVSDPTIQTIRDTCRCSRLPMTAGDPAIQAIKIT